jgi:hypothetical protein
MDYYNPDKVPNQKENTNAIFSLLGLVGIFDTGPNEGGKFRSLTNLSIVE